MPSISLGRLHSHRKRKIFRNRRQLGSSTPGATSENGTVSISNTDSSTSSTVSSSSLGVSGSQSTSSSSSTTTSSTTTSPMSNSSSSTTSKSSSTSRTSISRSSTSGSTPPFSSSTPIRASPSHSSILETTVTVRITPAPSTTTQFSTVVSVSTVEPSGFTATASLNQGAGAGGGAAAFFRRRGAIAGVTVGAILAVAILALWFLIIARRNARRRRERDNHSPTYRDQDYARSPVRRSMLMDDDEHAERIQNLRASPSYSNEKGNTSRFALTRQTSYRDATSPSSDNQYEDGLGDSQMDSNPLNSDALSQFPSPPTSLKPRAGLRRRPKSVTSLKGVVFEMETNPSLQHSRSATHADTGFGIDPPSPTQASSSHGHSSSSHAETSSSSHGHSNDWSHSRSNISHGTSFTSVPSHTDTGKGKGKAPPPWTHGGIPLRPSSSGSGQGSSQGHSSQDHSTSSSLRPGSSGSHLSSSQGHESSFSSLSSPNTTSASTSEENIRSSKRRSKPRVQFNLQPPPLSRAEVAERKASITSPPAYSSDSLLIVPSTIGSYPQNFTPPSKTTLPQLRTITPSPPSSQRSNSPPSPANSDHGHGLDELEEHEDRLYESRLDPRVTFDLKPPPLESEVMTPESFGPRDDEDYTRRLNIPPGYFPVTPATREEEVDDPMVAFSGASTIKTTTTTGH